VGGRAAQSVDAALAAPTRYPLANTLMTISRTKMTDRQGDIETELRRMREEFRIRAIFARQVDKTGNSHDNRQ
jgi:hypothetical protein